MVVFKKWRQNYFELGLLEHHHALMQTTADLVADMSTRDMSATRSADQGFTADRKSVVKP